MKLPNVLLMGDSGTGKTTALLSLIECGITPFVIATESNALPVFAKARCPSLHYCMVTPGAVSWQALQHALDQVNKLSNDALQKMAGVEKHKHNQILRMVGACHNFTCQRCGEQFGDVSEWDDTRAIIVDSLSGVNDLALGNAVGGKPILTQPDWGVSMRSELMLIQMLTNIPNAMFVLIAHLAQERDPVTGRILKMPSALGTKNAPEFPRMFTDVITARRELDKFSWSTVEADTVARAAHVPLSGNMAPNFKQMIATWREVCEATKETEQGQSANTNRTAGGAA